MCLFTALEIPHAACRLLRALSTWLPAVWVNAGYMDMTRGRQVTITATRTLLDAQTNKAGNVRINVTLRRVRVTTVADEKQ